MAKKKQPTPLSGLTATVTTNSTPLVTIAGTTTNWSSGWSTGTIYTIPTSIPIGTGAIEEIDGELWWVRADGSKSCLTGKSNNFKQIYDILNDDGKEA